MTLLGIGVNLDHKLVICIGCNSVVTPKKLYDHVRIPGHHIKKDFHKNQRLAFATREFCENLVNFHQLVNPPQSQRPNKIIPAIPGLIICKDMLVCNSCGYAVEHAKSFQRHCRKTCPQAKAFIGPAQKFISSQQGYYFGVTLPQHPKHSNPNPLDPAVLFSEQFGSDSYVASPVQATIDPREMTLFLNIEKWLVEVEGMTGEQMNDLARAAQPELRDRVRKTVSNYILETVTKLEATEHAAQEAIGDYDKCVFPLSPSIIELF